MTGDDTDRDVACQRIIAKVAEGAHTVPAGHGKIEGDEIRVFGPGHFHGFITVGGLTESGAVVGEEVEEKCADILVVVHHENHRTR